MPPRGDDDYDNLSTTFTFSCFDTDVLLGFITFNPNCYIEMFLSLKNICPFIICLYI